MGDLRRPRPFIHLLLLLIIILIYFTRLKANCFKCCTANVTFISVTAQTNYQPIKMGGV